MIITREPTLRILGILLASSGSVALAGGGNSHSHDHSAHDMNASIGIVDFPIACSDHSQQVFNDGISQIHNMMYIEAEAMFNSALEKEPDCAMLHWGVAMSNFHPLWPGVPSDVEIERGTAATKAALSLNPEQELEADLINSVAAMYKEGTPYPKRLKNWADSMADLYKKYPDHTDITAFNALAMLSVADKGDKTMQSQAEAGAIIESLHLENPDHPAGFHYMIHAYDNPMFADRAETISHAYDKLAPDAPHALHMPSHIFVRLGHWNETIRWNERSAESALEVSGEDTTQAHYAHAIDYLVYGLLQKGNVDKANEYLGEMLDIDNHQISFAAAYAMAASPARIPLETEKWEEASNLDIRLGNEKLWQRFPQAEGISHFARGIGAARSGNQQMVDTSLENLATIRQQLLDKNIGYWAKLADSQWHSVAAWSAFESGDKAKGLELMTMAADIEDSVDKSPVTPSAVLPARELLGDMYLAANQPQQALEAYQAALEISRNRTRSLRGAHLAANQLGNEDLSNSYKAAVASITE